MIIGAAIVIGRECVFKLIWRTVTVQIFVYERRRSRLLNGIATVEFYDADSDAEYNQIKQIITITIAISFNHLRFPIPSNTNGD